MPLVTEPVRCPPLVSDRWLGGGPVVIGAGTITLVDFWDYTCVNCLATLPYLRAWHERYRDVGLQIAGVHAPEFAFARDAGNVARAMAALGVSWPVAIDNDYRIWQAYANRYWPAKYLADGRGYLRFEHAGEGAYGETEAAIQALLVARDPAIAGRLPPLLAPYRPRDVPGAVCPRPTPELYLGFRRGRFGPHDLRHGATARYRLPARRERHVAYLDGSWALHDEYAEAGEGAAVCVQYQAAEVNAVIHPGPDGAAAGIELTLDGGPVPARARGADIAERDGRTVVPVATPRMYRLIQAPIFEEHDLRLRTRSAGVRLYALTFVSCTAVA